MKKEIADKWIAALRSGKYKQAKMALRDPENDSYCCLGVLCDISGLGEWITYELSRPYYQLTDHDLSSKVLPDGVKEWAGMRDCYGEMPLINRTLTAENDKAGSSFEQIASLIEQNWTVL